MRKLHFARTFHLIPSPLFVRHRTHTQESVERSLQTIHDIATDNLGTLCVTKSFRPLHVALHTRRFDGARQKVDMAAAVLQEVGVNRHGGIVHSDAPILHDGSTRTLWH